MGPFFLGHRGMAVVGHHRWRLRNHGICTPPHGSTTSQRDRGGSPFGMRCGLWTHRRTLGGILLRIELAGNARDRVRCGRCGDLRGARTTVRRSFLVVGVVSCVRGAPNKRLKLAAPKVATQAVIFFLLSVAASGALNAQSPARADSVPVDFTGDGIAEAWMADTVATPDCPCATFALRCLGQRRLSSLNPMVGGFLEARVDFDRPRSTCE